MEVKKIDFSRKEFMANGKKYTISDKISINRYAEYQRLLPKLTYGITFDEIQKNLKVAYTHLNKQSFADAAVVIHNVMNGISLADDLIRRPPGLKMAALFINGEGEDVKNYDEDVINQKIEDWATEGYDAADFFALALNSIEGFREAYLESIPQKEMIENLKNSLT